jgi:hypothetical protein
VSKKYVAFVDGEMKKPGKLYNTAFDLLPECAFDQIRIECLRDSAGSGILTGRCNKDFLKGHHNNREGGNPDDKQERKIYMIIGNAKNFHPFYMIK